MVNTGIYINIKEDVMKHNTMENMDINERWKKRNKEDNTLRARAYNIDSKKAKRRRMFTRDEQDNRA